VLTLHVTEYSFGSERGHWSADRSSFKYANSDMPINKQERCQFSLTGRVLALTDCRIAGRFTRVQLSHRAEAVGSRGSGLRRRAGASNPTS
jgi:hypothetical protein